jgi:hypothetical protein
MDYNATRKPELIKLLKKSQKNETKLAIKASRLEKELDDKKVEYQNYINNSEALDAELRAKIDDLEKQLADVSKSESGGRVELEGFAVKDTVRVTDWCLKGFGESGEVCSVGMGNIVVNLKKHGKLAFHPNGLTMLGKYEPSAPTCPSCATKQQQIDELSRENEALNQTGEDTRRRIEELGRENKLYIQVEKRDTEMRGRQQKTIGDLSEQIEGLKSDVQAAEGHARRPTDKYLHKYSRFDFIKFRHCNLGRVHDGRTANQRPQFKNRQPPNHNSSAHRDNLRHVQPHRAGQIVDSAVDSGVVSGVVGRHGMTQHDYRTWKVVDGFDGKYWVSSDGDIVSAHSKLRVLTQCTTEKGYMVVYLSVRGKRRKLKVHRIVMSVFNGANDKMQIDHINGDKSDNRVKNLEYVTCEENVRRYVKKCNFIQSPMNVVIAVRDAVGIEKANCETCVWYGSDGDGYEYNGSWPVCNKNNSRVDNLVSFPFKKDMACWYPEIWMSAFSDRMTDERGEAIQSVVDEFYEITAPLDETHERYMSKDQEREEQLRQTADDVLKEWG